MYNFSYQHQHLYHPQQKFEHNKQLPRTYSRQCGTQENFADGAGIMERLERVRETLNLLRLRLELEKKQLAEEKREAGVFLPRTATTVPVLNARNPSRAVATVPQTSYVPDMRLAATPYEENLSCQVLQSKMGFAPSMSAPHYHYTPAYFSNPTIYKYYNDLQADKYNLAYYSCKNLAAAAAYREHLDRVDKMCNQEFLKMQKSLG